MNWISHCSMRCTSIRWRASKNSARCSGCFAGDRGTALAPSGIHGAGMGVLGARPAIADAGGAVRGRVPTRRRASGGCRIRLLATGFQRQYHHRQRQPLCLAGCRRSAAAGRIDRRHAARSPGLIRVQSALITELFSGTRWRLGGLSSDQVRAVTPEPAKTHQRHEFDKFDRELFLALQRDGRLSFRDLAAAVEPVGAGGSSPLGPVDPLRNAGVPNRFRACGSRLADRAWRSSSA